MTGPGRLGRPLLEALHRRGVGGSVLHRRAAATLPPGWRFISADVTRPESLAGACADCEHVLHLAAVTHSNRSGEYERVNAGGTMNLIAEARRAGVRRFTLVSTRAISPAGGAYSLSKLHAEAMVRASGLEWNILRPAEVYGAGGEGIAALIERCRAGRCVPIVGDGSARLAPIHLEDAVEGICRALALTASGRVIELAGPEEMTYLKLVHRLAKYFGTRPRTLHVPAALLHLTALALAPLPIKKPPIYVDQVSRLLSPKSYDPESARSHLGLTCRPLEAGLGAPVGAREG
ncbi:MAG: NAD-dependent epimerase/dehydratase family protein [Acidobacteriota bacterium]